MNSYIIKTRCIANELVNLINSEEKELKRLNNESEIVKAQIRRISQHYKASEYNMPDNMTESLLQRTYRSFYSYDNEIFINLLKLQIKQIDASLAVKYTSVNLLCGSLIQIAKQGISTVRFGLRFCPNGRYIGNETLKNIIWQAWNQSIHYEEDRHRPYHQSVIDCFDSLHSNFGSKINLTDNNFSKKIIELLGWKVYSQYEQDMILLLGGRND